MNQRQRMTWAGLDREAAAAPATPGYGVEDQDHPAHIQDDPGKDDYNIGGPSEFGEDVHKPPYGDSGAPALPGVGVEDQDHPAHQGQVGRRANVMDLVRAKSAKALKLAKATLGKKAQWADIEEQAFNYMSMDDDALDASLARHGGGFLAEEEPVADPNSDLLARLDAMEQELVALKRANQNDPKGPTLGTSGKSAEEEKREEAAVSKQARAKLARLFTACDVDNDGFVTQDEWMGSPAVFAALDRDRDGIIAKHEVLAGEVPEAFKEQWKDKGEGEDDKKDEDKKDEDKDEDKKDEKESGKKAAKKAEDEDEKDAGKKGGKKSEDEVEAEDEDEKDAGKKGGKKAAKVAFGGLADFDDDEMEMLQAMNFGLEADDVDPDPAGPTACGGPTAAKTADDDEDKPDEDDAEDKPDEDDAEDPDKEASFFAIDYDPMGLSDGAQLTAADKAAFEEVFGKQAADEDKPEDKPEDEKDAGKKAGKKSEDEDEGKKLAGLLRPQPRKASTGVRSVGAVPKTASDEIRTLEDMWARDPDVSGSFS